MLERLHYHADQRRMYAACYRNALFDSTLHHEGALSGSKESQFREFIRIHAGHHVCRTPCFLESCHQEGFGSLGTVCIGLCAASLVSMPFAVYIILSEGLLLASVPFIIATGIIHAFYFYFIGKSYEIGDISIVYPTSRGIGVAGTSLIAATMLGESISVNGFIGIMLVCSGTVTLGLQRAQDGNTRKALLYTLAVGLTIICYSCLDKVGVGLSNPVPYIWGMFTVAAVLLTSFVAVNHRDNLIQSWKKRGPME